MVVSSSRNSYKMPLTLEHHFEDMANEDCNIKNLYSVWMLLKKRLTEQLPYSRSVYPTFSVHDATHSQSIIVSIERLLGENRVSSLSPTDTFMLLVCAYAHDYGMALTYNQIFKILDDKTFIDFIEELNANKDNLSEEDYKSVHILWKLRNNVANELNIQDIYQAINNVLQMYLRPSHSIGVEEIEHVFKDIFSGVVEKRFINGSEGIIKMCQCHGLRFSNVMEMTKIADGLVGDYYHPRFVAVMLRMGDLLDLDNGRFPLWFVNEVEKNTKLISEQSKRHFYKHESVTHVLITPQVIEIEANCGKDNCDGGDKDARQVAKLLNDWLGWLEEEMNNTLLNWSEIAPDDFGLAPGKLIKKIYLNDHEYNAKDHFFQMNMSQDRVTAILQGSNIYNSKYVGIREIIQNAVDASLLQMWQDILNNRYSKYGINSEIVKNGITFKDFISLEGYKIFENYPIKLEVIKSLKDHKIYIKVIDKGIGILENEVKYLASIGSSKVHNTRIQNVLKTMPDWLKPAGVFGIGLQAIFQISNGIEFNTKQSNGKVLNIRMSSTGQSRGSIDYLFVDSNKDEIFQGTSVTIEVEKSKIVKESLNFNSSELVYFEKDFDSDMDELDALYYEISSECNNIVKRSETNYFKIQKSDIIVYDSGELFSQESESRESYFRYRDNNELVMRYWDSIKPFVDNIDDFPFAFEKDNIYYWDENNYRIYKLTFKKCNLRMNPNSKTNWVYLPESTSEINRVSFKFEDISNLHNLTLDNTINTGFVLLDVIMLDNKPQKYLNIDRDTLRNDSISPGEIQSVKVKMLTEWGKRIINGKLNKINFDKTKLIPMMLSFYQNVSTEIFSGIKSIYEKDIQDNHFKLSGFDHEIGFLWKENTQFLTLLDQSGKYIFLSEQMATQFPSSLISIKELVMCEDVYQYVFLLTRNNEKLKSIDLHDMVMIGDILGACDYTAGVTLDGCKGEVINVHNLISTLFKPNKKYCNLIVGTYPKSFVKHTNLKERLNYVIDTYILSPFDEEICDLLSSCLCGFRGANIKDLENEIRITDKHPIFNKCVNYVCVQNNYTDEQRKIVIEEYIDFMIDVCNAIISYKSFVGY